MLKLKKLNKKTGFDYPLLIFTLLLFIFGTAMVFSAGAPYAAARYNDAFYFIKRQIIWGAIGIVTMAIASKIPASAYKKVSAPLYFFTLVLLALVLVIGLVGNGAKRWISIGPITIQPSEIAKLSLILMLAKYFSDCEISREKRNKKDILKYGTFLPLLIMIIPIVLVMLQKHLSCIIILGLLGLLLTVCAGVDTRYIRFCCILGASFVTAFALFTDYTKERITVWRNPEAYKLTGGWQTLQGLMAIGSGGIFGLGYGNSIMKHCYVSEPANDMIFAILAEELGFIGAFLAIALFALLIGRGLLVATRSADTYSRLVAIGISIKMAIQVLLNIGVVTNTIPNTGISLPFFSYGGSSLIMIFFEMGMLLSISKSAKITK